MVNFALKKETKHSCLEGGIPLSVQCSNVAGWSWSGLGGSERTEGSKGQELKCKMFHW